jgi:hypothetical protein
MGAVNRESAGPLTSFLCPRRGFCPAAADGDGSPVEDHEQLKRGCFRPPERNPFISAIVSAPAVLLRGRIVLPTQLLTTALWPHERHYFPDPFTLTLTPFSERTMGRSKLWAGCGTARVRMRSSCNLSSSRSPF